MSSKKSDSMVEVFLFEANGLTEQLENILLESEENKQLSTDNINEIFRIMHTLKGSSAMMELMNISTVAHRLEDLFFYFRENPDYQVDVSAVCDIVFKALDYIRNSLDDYQNGAQDGDEQQAKELISLIKGYLDKIKKGGNAPAKKEASKPEKQKSDDEESDQGVEANYKVTVFFTEACSMHIARSFLVIKALTKYVQNLYHYPEKLVSDEKIISYIIDNGLELRFYSEADYYFIKDTIENVSEVKTAVIQHLTPEENESAQEEKSEGEQVEMKVNPAKKAQEAPKAPAHVKQSIISVNVNKLDSLMDIVGELVISESMVIDNPDLQGLGELPNFSKAARQLSKLTYELQDLAISMRMVPVEMSFSKMHRIVRDMSKKLNKEVELKIIGESTEVDKSVIDSLSDPLMHLIRNSMDHGIETAEERVKAGKPPKGTITLEAKSTGSDVIITVSDDGRGLNKDKIIEKAIANGLTTKSPDEISDKEAYNFILLPGFSTKEKVTEFSGRGVGMDVVKKNIENVRGTVSVKSKPGEGTSILIKIPLTLAIIEGMRISCGDEIYIIPTQSILQSFKPEEKDLFLDAQGNDMVRVRDNGYPIVKLSEMFGIEGGVTNPTDGIVIMTEEDGRVLCLLVDAILGQHSIVVKTIPKFLSRYKLKSKGIGGCTILGNGMISLILDVAELSKNFYN